jgi:hypothetical protein
MMDTVKECGGGGGGSAVLRVLHILGIRHMPTTLSRIFSFPAAALL